MDDKNQKETVQGYEIKRAVLFEDKRGFALAHSPNAPDPFVTWQFTQGENGARDYYWGRYASSLESATSRYEDRIDHYRHETGLSVVGGYKYYPTQRPVDIGTYPKTAENTPVIVGNFDKREPVEDGKFQAWGFLIYDAPLTAKQIYDYELRPAPDNFDVVVARNKELVVMREQAQVVGHWEDMKGLPEEKRFTWHRPSIHAFDLREPVVSPEQMAGRYRRARHDFDRADRQTAPKPIAQQLAEAEKQVRRDTPQTTDKKPNRDER